MKRRFRLKVFLSVVDREHVSNFRHDFNCKSNLNLIALKFSCFAYTDVYHLRIILKIEGFKCFSFLSHFQEALCEFALKVN